MTEDQIKELLQKEIELENELSILLAEKIEWMEDKIRMQKMMGRAEEGIQEASRLIAEVRVENEDLKRMLRVVMEMRG